MKFNLATFSMLAYGVTAISLSSANTSAALEGLEAGLDFEGSVNSFLAQNSYQDENVHNLIQTYSDLDSKINGHLSISGKIEAPSSSEKARKANSRSPKKEIRKVYTCDDDSEDSEPSKKLRSYRRKSRRTSRGKSKRAFSTKTINISTCGATKASRRL